MVSATHDERDEPQEHPDFYGGLGAPVIFSVRLHEYIGKAGRERYSRDDKEQRRIAEFKQFVNAIHRNR